MRGACLECLFPTAVLEYLCPLCSRVRSSIPRSSIPLYRGAVPFLDVPCFCGFYDSRSLNMWVYAHIDLVFGIAGEMTLRGLVLPVGGIKVRPTPPRGALRSPPRFSLLLSSLSGSTLLYSLDLLLLLPGKALSGPPGRYSPRLSPSTQRQRSTRPSLIRASRPHFHPGREYHRRPRGGLRTALSPYLPPVLPLDGRGKADPFVASFSRGYDWHHACSGSRT